MASNKKIDLAAALGNVAATKARKNGGSSNLTAEQWFDKLLGLAYPTVDFTYYHKTDNPAIWIVAWTAKPDPTQQADTPADQRAYLPSYDQVKTTLSVMRPPNPIFSDNDDFFKPNPHVIRIHPLPITTDEVPQIGAGLTMSQKERIVAIETALAEGFNWCTFKVAPVKTTDPNLDAVSIHWHGGATEAQVAKTLEHLQDGVTKTLVLIRTLDKAVIQDEVNKLYLAREIARAAGKLKPEDEQVDVVTATMRKLKNDSAWD